MPTRRRVALTCAAAALLAGCSSAGAPDRASSVPGRSSVPSPSIGTATATAAMPDPHPDLSSFRAPRMHEGVALPVGVRIPSLGVRSGLEALSRAPDDTIEVPQDPDSAGWYVDGARPGQVGPAVILGHVNSTRGPAVFARLPELRPGDEIVVDREDGSSATFAVTRTEQYPKTGFPTEDVYYPTSEAELRLVTCGGPVAAQTGRHRDNVIVWATLRS